MKVLHIHMPNGKRYTITDLAKIEKIEKFIKDKGIKVKREVVHHRLQPIIEPTLEISDPEDTEYGYQVSLDINEPEEPGYVYQVSESDTPLYYNSKEKE